MRERAFVMCAHFMHVCKLYVASLPVLFLCLFCLSELFVKMCVRNVQLCDVTCLFSLSEKRQGSMDFPCKSETWQTQRKPFMRNEWIIHGILRLCFVVSHTDGITEGEILETYERLICDLGHCLLTKGLNNDFTESGRDLEMWMWCAQRVEPCKEPAENAERSTQRLK